MVRRVWVGAIVGLIAILGVAGISPPPAYAADACTVSNILVNSCRPWIGATSHAYGLNSFRDHIEHHEARAGRQMDIVHDYLQPNEMIDADQRYYINRADTILLLNWKLTSTWASGAGSNATVNAYIDRMADSINGLGDKKIMLNVWHEPEDNVSAGGAPSCGSKVLRGTAGKASDYVAMWHNVRARFDAKGVDNVVWVVNYMGWTNWYCMTRDLWPGNDYVDWVMWDPYPNNTTWRSFVGSFYDHLTANTDATHAFTSKPWGIAEYGYKGPSQTAAYQMYADIRGNVDRFSRLKAYVAWDAKNSGGYDERVRHSATGAVDQREQDAYNALVHDPLFTTPAGPGDTTPPSTPGGLSASTANPPGVRLSWAAATDETGVTGYTVRRNGSALATTATTSYTDLAVTAGTSYTYTVTAHDAAGNTSAASGPVTVVAPNPPQNDTSPPTSVGSITATQGAVGSRSITVTWTAASDNVGVTSYWLYRGNGKYQLLSGTTLSFTDSGLTAGTRYTYKLYALDAAGNWGPSSANASATAR